MNKPIKNQDWLNDATKQLKQAKINSLSPRLDAELILAKALNLSRIELHLASNQTLTEDKQQQANQLLSQRLQHYPLAYLLGSKEFYSRTFIVSPAVLIPRPESETLVDISLSLIQTRLQKTKLSLADVGSGSGCLGLTLALELERLGRGFNLDLIDISAEALEICHKNKTKLQVLNTKFIQSDLLDKSLGTYDLIIANLPYVDPKWSFIGQEIQHEPNRALFADDNGLALINKLIAQINQKKQLKDKGFLVLESDPSQQTEIRLKLQQSNFKNIGHSGYATWAELNYSE